MHYPKQTDNYDVDIFNQNFRELANENSTNENNLQNEIARAKAAEKVNADAISTEVVRAKEAEETNADSIVAESNRAKTVEALKAPIDSPVFTGTPQAPTPETSANDLRIATTAFVKAVINALIDGAPETLDTLREVADAIVEHREITDALNAAIGTKVDKVVGKGLSTNDYTTAEKNKLSGIAPGAQVNVQSDFDVTDSNSDAYIKNKPTIPTKTSELVNDSGFLTSESAVAGVSGVKGNVETTYRTGNVNLTPSDIGAVSISRVLTTRQQIVNSADYSYVAGASAVKEIDNLMLSNVQNLAGQVEQIKFDLFNKIDKSSTSELIISKNFSWTENFQALSIDRGVIPKNGYLHLIFQIGNERYSVFFDTIRGVVQPFFLGQNDTYNFYIGIRIDSDTQLSLCVKDIKGYRLDGGFANKPIWLRTYYTS